MVEDFIEQLITPSPGLNLSGLCMFLGVAIGLIQAIARSPGEVDRWQIAHADDPKAVAQGPPMNPFLRFMLIVVVIGFFVGFVAHIVIVISRMQA